MPGLLTLEGDNRSIGECLGRYWGNYFAFLNIQRRNSEYSLGQKSYHRRLYKQYRGWLTKKRDEKSIEIVQAKIRKDFPQLWEEIEGMCKGLQNSNLRYRKEINLNALFSCIMAEADESACSTAILFGKEGYTMVHSDEYEGDSDEHVDTAPVVAAHVALLQGKGKKKRFFSISHPFQLLGSAAGMNDHFAVQGNSIGCVEDVDESAIRNIPKTVLSRIILERDSPKEAMEIYKKHPCSLHNHHLFVTKGRIFSLKSKVVSSSKATHNQVTLVEVKLGKGKTYCHTNHFRDNSDLICDTCKVESIDRLNALKSAVKGAKTPVELEEKFFSFLLDYQDQRRKRLLDMVSAIFSFQVGPEGPPYLRSLTFSNSWKF